MIDWTDPRYAKVVKAMREAQARAAESGEGKPRTVRGFILPDEGGANPGPQAH
ncbi:hypothetical protein QZH56_32285 [Streptomyces olivoreticuli]|uniref:hypothetical protein n=1 Tax=Streptomyces olivoreticuli TaxID=68246 RepID=UPI002658AC08|nr:hypothetical protein [Streptomyces olivoreticuli]WKK23357.1 hypothetical protein QZH56_32285 [Streptomyces olivoreticuli]